VTGAELIAELERRGVSLRVDGERLRVRAPSGTLTPGVAAELEHRKDVLMRVLRRRDAGGGPISPAPRTGELPLSFAQQRLWFLDQLEPGSAFYNSPVVVRVRGPLDVATLGRSLDVLVARHEILSTRFPAEDGRPHAVVEPVGAVDVVVDDLDGVAGGERDAEARRRATAEIRRQFDLAAGPLVRCAAYRVSADDHIVALTIHHVLADAWSSVLIVSETAEVYAALTAGQEPAGGPPEIQHIDYAVWQRTPEASARADEQVGYWRDALAGLRPLELPTDRPRPATQTFRGARRSFALEPELSGQVRSLARAHKATPFMTLLAALAVVFHRYTQETDIAIGTPIAGRTSRQLSRMIGFFANTLVLRCDLAGDPSFRTVLERCRATALDAYGHQDVPFERLVEELAPARDLSRTPLVQVLLAVQPDPMGAVDFPGLTLEPLAFDTGTAKFDLDIEITDGADGFTGWIEYSTDLFDEATVARLVEHLRAVLAGAVADPDRPVAELPLLTAAERGLLLEAWNDTAVPVADDCLHRRFERQVQATPDAVAVVFGGEQATYAELDRRANQVARQLRGLGVGPDVPVAVCVERSIEMVAALLGVLKAGGAYVPLDPSHPADRLAYIVEDSGAAAVVAHQHLADRLPATEAPVVWVGGGGQAGVDDGPVEDRNTPDDLAYVIYTSGSTGRPKGVEIEHRSICDHLAGMQQEMPLTPDDVVLQKTTLTFDDSVWEVFWPLVTGARLAVAAPDGHRDPAYLVEAMRAYGVTTMEVVPTQLVGLVAEPGLELCRALRRVICSGDVLTSDLRDRFHARTRAELVNLYGPTEGTIDVTIWRCGRDDHDPVVPIGKPLPNYRMYVLDGRLQPAPIGAVGEICVAGVGLARGYLGRPELTAERFVADPFTAGGRLYRTGDLGRWRADGVLEFLGRADNQVKIRGFRVELGEIEATLAAHPDVRECVVTAWEDRGERSLVAYVVAHGPAPTVSALRDFLTARLPSHLVPSLFIALDAMPLTTNAKVDRAALPPPDGSRPELDGEYVAPRTPEEAALAEVWADVLGVERVGVEDNFFELGGDSILSIQIVARARQAGLRVTPKQLFDHQTVAGVAASAERGDGDPTAEQGPVTGPAPLAPFQRWFLDAEPPEPHHFNQAVMWALPDGGGPGPLAEALADVLAHHDALRARFTKGPGGWSQDFAAPGEVEPLLDVRDLSAVPDAGLAAAVEAAAAEVQAGLDLAAGPLLAAGWFDLGGERGARLLLVAHALVFDAFSWRILGEDLATAYLARLEGREPELPAKTASFKAWAEQRAAADAPVEGPPAALPADHQGPDLTSSERVVAWALDADATARLVQRPAVDGVLVEALARTLAEWAEEPVAVDVLAHNREPLDGLDVSRTIGRFASHVPGRPPAAVRFNYLGQMGRALGELPLETAPEPMGPTRAPAAPRPYALDVSAALADGVLDIEWAYSANRHDRETVEALAQSFADHLVAIVGEPSQETT